MDGKRKRKNEIYDVYNGEKGMRWGVTGADAGTGCWMGCTSIYVCV